MSRNEDIRKGRAAGALADLCSAQAGAPRIQAYLQWLELASAREVREHWQTWMGPWPRSVSRDPDYAELGPERRDFLSALTSAGLRRGLEGHAEAERLPRLPRRIIETAPEPPVVGWWPTGPQASGILDRASADGWIWIGGWPSSWWVNDAQGIPLAQVRFHSEQTWLECLRALDRIAEEVLETV